jgi:hypothetical protein
MPANKVSDILYVVFPYLFSSTFLIRSDCIKCTEEFSAFLEALGNSCDTRVVRSNTESRYTAALLCTYVPFQV